MKSKSEIGVSFQRMLGSLFILMAAWALPAQTAPTFKVLAFYSASWDLAHISFAKEANQWFPQIAAQQGFSYESTTDWSRISASGLAGYQVVMFLDDQPPAAQRAAFQDYMAKGGAWMGFHVVAFNQNPAEWDWYYNQFLGMGSYKSNTWAPTSAVLRVEHTAHPATTRLPLTFVSQPNEWYGWTVDLRTKSNIDILLSIDPSSFPLGTGTGSGGASEIWTSGYYPVVWTNKNYKMMYVNMGHNDIDYAAGNATKSWTFQNEIQNRLIIDGLMWLGSGFPVAPNLALNKPVTASTTESSAYAGSKAVDGSATSRWSSTFADPQWISVDLGATYDISRVKLVWETACGKDYQIQVSLDGTTWNTMKTVTGNTALSTDYTGLTGRGRYVRVHGTARATAWGYSIYELEVNGKLATSDTQAPSAPLNLISTMVSNSQVGLSWGASADNVGVAGYDVYKNGTYSVSSTSISTTATGLAAGTPYTFTVKGKDAAGNFSGASAPLSVTTSEVNLALNKPVVPTSNENATYSGAMAVDGSASTRWSSTFADNQNFAVDLGAATSISKVIIVWEAAYATQYELQTSTDNTNWTTVYSTSVGTGGTSNLTFPATQARWVRMRGLKRATPYGFSFFEFGIY